MTILVHAIYRNAFPSKFVFWRGLLHPESCNLLRHPACPIRFELFTLNFIPLYPSLFYLLTSRTHPPPWKALWFRVHNVKLCKWIPLVLPFLLKNPLRHTKLLSRLEQCRPHELWESLPLDKGLLATCCFLRSKLNNLCSHENWDVL